MATEKDISRNPNFLLKEQIYDRSAKLTKWIILCEDVHLELAQQLAVSLKNASV